MAELLRPAEPISAFVFRETMRARDAENERLRAALAVFADANNWVYVADRRAWEWLKPISHDGEFEGPLDFAEDALRRSESA